MLPLSDESAIDLHDPLDLGSDDEFSFEELVELNCATEEEELKRDEKSAKDEIELVIKTIEDENTSANLLNEEPQQPPQINTMTISVLNTSDLKKCAREKGSAIGQKRKAEPAAELKRLIIGGDAFKDEVSNATIAPNRNR